MSEQIAESANCSGITPADRELIDKARGPMSIAEFVAVIRKLPPGTRSLKIGGADYIVALAPGTPAAPARHST